MKISVYITSYNQKPYLKEAIESVINQTLKPFEIIIVDDCSTDGSQNLIKEYANKYDYIKYLFHNSNKGISQVRITALASVKGDFVTYLDGDDIYLPRKLEIESNIILENNCDVAFSNNLYVDENNINNVNRIWACDYIDISKNLFVKTIARDFPRESLFRMELVNYNLLKRVGFHDLNLKIYEDYDLRIRLSQKGKFGYSLEPTTKIRISSKGLSKLPLNEHIKAFEYIFHKYSQDINNLDIQNRSYLKAKLSFLLDKLYSANSVKTDAKDFKNGIFSKFKNIIKKLR